MKAFQLRDNRPLPFDAWAKGLEWGGGGEVSDSMSPGKGPIPRCGGSRGKSLSMMQSMETGGPIP